MDIIPKRVTNFIDRSRWLGKIMDSPYKAGLHWIKIRFFPQLKAFGKYGAYRFSFRGQDMPIVREIIHEKEYDFLKPDIAKLNSLNVIDVGSHIGLFSLGIFNSFPTASILSVEASPETFEILSDNIRMAKTEHQVKWQAVNRAAWSDNEPIKFNNATLSMSQRVSDVGEVEVKGIDLHEVLILSKSDKIDLMKIDVEGAEEAFLCSASSALERVDRLVIELHKECCDTEKIEGLLKGVYPHVEYVEGRYSSRPVLYCYK